MLKKFREVHYRPKSRNSFESPSNRIIQTRTASCCKANCNGRYDLGNPPRLLVVFVVVDHQSWFDFTLRLTSATLQDLARRRRPYVRIINPVGLSESVTGQPPRTPATFFIALRVISNQGSFSHYARRRRRLCLGLTMPQLPHHLNEITTTITSTSTSTRRALTLSRFGSSRSESLSWFCCGTCLLSPPSPSCFCLFNRIAS